MNNKMICMVSNEWFDIRSNLLTKYGDLTYSFYVFLILNQNSQKKNKENNISSVSISHFLDFLRIDNRTTRTRKFKEVLNMLKILENNKLIVFYSDLLYSNTIKLSDNIKHSDMLYIELRFSDLDNNTFTLIYFDDINKIIKSNITVGVPQLLSYFSSIAYFINSKTKLAYPSLEALSNMNDSLSQTTCIKYNKILRDLELIYYDCAGIVNNSESGCRSYNNTYARYNDRYLVDEYIKKERNGNKIGLTNTSKSRQDKANKLRSLSTSIRHAKNKMSDVGLSEDEKIKLDKFEKEYAELKLTNDESNAFSDN